LREGKEKEATFAKDLLMVVSPKSPFVHYQLARGYARNNLPFKAIEHIEQAMQFGLKDKEFLRNTKEFKSLGTNKEFIRILKDY
ncbi:MAG: hypothetical protein HKN52_05000, partial [Eudoraea sp.]|nr:hypothetical protein [Eudoraea sp.]